MSDLEKAIEIAVSAHRGGEDKAGDPYILHPLSLMLQFDDLDEMIVAVLHDTVEDSSLTLGALEEAGFSSAVVTAVDALTRRENESYQEFISRLGSNSLARQVKLADLEHNMDVRRLKSVTSADLDRIAKAPPASLQTQAHEQVAVCSGRDWEFRPRGTKAWDWYHQLPFLKRDTEPCDPWELGESVPPIPGSFPPPEQCIVRDPPEPEAPPCW